MYLQSSKGQIYYQKIGQGPDLILLHGWQQDVSSFWQLADKLKSDWTVWLIDLPGFGRSPLTKSEFELNDYVESVVDFIKQLKLDKPILLGHSLGGRVGIKLAAKYPNLISRLILEDAAGIRPIPTTKSKMLAATAKIANQILPNWFNFKDKLRARVYSQLQSDYLSTGELKETFKNIINEDLTPYLSQIKAETFLIWGENDFTVPVSFGKKMYRLIPNSRLEIIEQAGHFPHLDQPDRFEYWLRNFLSKGDK